MAEFAVEGSELVLRLTAEEKLEAVHGDVRVALSAVRSVEVVADALLVAHGMRVGTGIPWVMLVGSLYGLGGSSFVVVHHGRPGGVVVHLDASTGGYDELIVGCENPEAVAAGIPVPGGS